jgi:hypothetical protein
MPEYKQPDADQAAALNRQADLHYTQGAIAGTHSDDYVRVTVYLATVLFLLAISGHFRVRSVRIGLVGVSVVALGFAVSQLVVLPLPPA